MSSTQERKSSLSKTEAQQAFIKYAADKCCFSTKPALEGQITNMKSFDTHRYGLETFTESRSTSWTLNPYSGEDIDSSSQTPPGRWEIPVHVPPLFMDGQETIEVPHTASVKDCSRCKVTGRTSCLSCSGKGQTQCLVCAVTGDGTCSNEQVCVICGGDKQTICLQCAGSGLVTCDTCCGQLKVVVSMKLNVKWTNNKEEVTVEQSSGLNMDKLGKVSGKKVFTESQKMVHPMTTFPDDAVVEISERLVSAHKDKYSQESRILQQRHTIELLPVTKVTYEWKGKPHVFFVYGTDLNVSAVDYPASCCGCCSLM